MEPLVQITVCQILGHVLTRAPALFPFYSSEVSWRVTGIVATELQMTEFPQRGGFGVSIV